FSAGHLARSFADPRVRRELERAHVRTPEDVLAFLLLTPAEVAAFTAGVPVNTDDNALIEFGAPRDLLGYHRYDSSVLRVYGASWPYGHLEDLLGPAGRDADADARLARALLGHGKLREAEEYATATAAAGGGAVAARLRTLLALARPHGDDDPEAPLADPPGLDPPQLKAGLLPRVIEERTQQFLKVERELKTRSYATALKILREWPERDVIQSGDDVRLLFAFLLYKTGFHSEALEHLKALAADPAFVARRPAVRYYLGRIDYVAGEYTRALRHFDAYIDARPADAAAVARRGAPASRPAAASQAAAAQPAASQASR
ncbi:MAG TPA: hypothetical protein VGQ83_14800, partial [Polyangia bacterium]